MKDENKDKYDIKKFAEVLDESLMMVPDSENRRNKAIGDLKDFMDAQGEGVLKDEEWLAKAKGFIESLE